jgi:hypothetical protein
LPVSREEAIRFELTTAAGAGIAIAKMFSARAGSTDALTFKGDPDDTKTEGVHALEWTMLEEFMLLDGPHQCVWRSYVGNQSGFHVINGLAIRGILTIGAEDRDHHRLQPQCGAISQPILAPPFLGLEHFDFSSILRRIGSGIAQ